VFDARQSLFVLQMLLKDLQSKLQHNRRGDIQEVAELKRQINSVQSGINNLTEAIQYESGETLDEAI
jgi:hypothetical protein